jgi:hypothetical protein
MSYRTFVLIASIALLVGCAKQSGGSSPAANFELDCDATNTQNASQLNCVRTDTRSGEVIVVDYMRLPVSNGPTTTGATTAGRFTTGCAATSTDTRADFYCIRMNTETGELLLINLTKVPVTPPKQ